MPKMNIKPKKVAIKSDESFDYSQSKEGHKEKYKKKLPPSQMSGSAYDNKMAYNKNLKPSARLHYLENERHDKTSGSSMSKHMGGRKGK